MKLNILTIAILPLVVCSCASTEPRPASPGRAIPTPPKAVVVEEPTAPHLSHRIEALENENSELRIQLLQNILTN